jgi:type VI secretion system secreted protein Hcp
MKALAIGFLLFLGLQFCVFAQTVTVTFDSTSGINGGGPVSLLSFKIGAQQAGLLSQAGTGASAGKSQFTPLTLYKNVDQTTPQLFISCATGKLIKHALLTVSGDTGQIFFQIALENVFIASINDDSTNSDGGIPFETFTLSYSKIGWEYLPTEGGQPVAGGFDVIRNVSVPFSSLLTAPPLD